MRYVLIQGHQYQYSSISIFLFLRYKYSIISGGDSYNTHVYVNDSCY